MTEASIIVPTRNRAASLARALASFVAQDCAPERYEILAVDNGSSDETGAVVRAAGARHRDHRIRCIEEPVPGLLSGRHRGAKEARGHILVFVDDDITAETGWLSAILDAFEDPAVHLVGGPSIPRFETDPPRWMERFFDHRKGRLICVDLSLLDIGDHRIKIDPTYVWGLNFAIRKQTLFDLGGFHPDCIPKHLQLFQGDGETGLSLKMREKRLSTVYAPAARVYHHIPRARLTVAYFEDRAFYQGVCDSYTRIRKNGGSEGIRPPDDVRTPQATGCASTYERYRAIVYQRISKAYVDGFRFHLDAVRADRRLLAWVLKEDYFDYRLPAQETGAGPNGESRCAP